MNTVSTPSTCTESSAAAGEALTGSAPDAAGWICLEQSGAWGAKAWTSSRNLDPELGKRIEDAVSGAGLRASLIRRPGRTTDTGTRTLLVASSHPARSWLLEARISDPATLLKLDLAAVAAGDLEATRASLPLLKETRPVLLVCTNGSRDTCCARLGRPIAAAAEAAHAGRVWEVTHTSGHRFAATTVLLPSGFLHGRVLDAAPLLKAADEGTLELTGLRGRSCWPAPGQVAEAAVREKYGFTGLDDVRVSGADEFWSVSHRDGRYWTVRVTSSVEGEAMPSCGKEPEPVRRWSATIS